MPLSTRKTGSNTSKRSTKEAEEHMEKQKIPCWIETHRRLKWRMARRIDSLHEKRWTKRIFDWHPGLDTRIKTRRQAGRPKRRWEDDLNEFLKAEETQVKTIRPDEQKQLDDRSKKYKEWKEKEDTFMKIQKEFFWAEKSNLFLERLAPNHPLQASFSFSTMFHGVQRPTLLVGSGDSSLHVITIDNTLRAPTGRDEGHEEDYQFRINRLNTLMDHYETFRRHVPVQPEDSYE